MKHVPSCPKPGCPDFGTPRSDVIRWGSFRRLDDSRIIQRFRCNSCRKTYSRATFTDECWQKKRRINHRVWFHLCGKSSLRNTAFYFGVTPKTVARKQLYLAKIARRYFAELPDRGLLRVQFDELQSSVQTKCKPVAIPMAVCSLSRRVLSLRVASMPAQHPLTEISLRKYGPRADDRPAAIREVLLDVKKLMDPRGQITTDRAERYPGPIAAILPGVNHDNHKSRRARSGGQAELKRIGFDPLFWINHGAAMCRDRVGRMVRKTWGNSKRADRLEDHLLVWAHFHNEVYLPWRASQQKGG